MKLLTLLKYIVVYHKRYYLAKISGQSSAVAGGIGCDGQTEVDELTCLAGLAHAVPSGGIILEVGSFRGRSCATLALAAPSDALVISVDPYLMTLDWRERVFEYSSRDQEICQLNMLLSKASGKVKNLHLTSAEAARGWAGRQPISLAFIDGSHLYEDVSLDLDSWLPLISPGGIMAFHDSTNTEWGVFPLMEELKVRDDIKFIEVVNSISVFQKMGRVGAS